jgi:hypothetical protein
MAWIETTSPSFTARHEEADAEAIVDVLARLERFRLRMGERFSRVPDGVAVVVHPGAWQLGLAHPWLPIARMAAAPASRRYFAGWFSLGEIHVLGPAALEERASRVAGSREALELAPLHEYAHLVVAANNPRLPPPFGFGGFARYLRWAWQFEGAAAYLSGQLPHLRPAIVRRLREGPRPAFPPRARDAIVLGGTLYGLLEREAGPRACAELATSAQGGARATLERAFGRPLAEVEESWRAHLDESVATGEIPARGRRRGRR